MTKTIKVLKVTEDETMVVLNAGDEEGVAVGEFYRIFHRDDQELIDPDTREPLGCWEIAAGKGIVIQVQKKLCTVMCISTNRAGKFITKAPLNELSTLLNRNFTSDLLYKDRVYDPVPFHNASVGDFAKKL